jgi:hypothetical protein
MSEAYQSKQDRRRRLLDALPAGLREHVSIRNIEAVAALSPPAQERLAEAVQAGLRKLPRAVEQLRIDPNTSVADLLNPPVQIRPAAGLSSQEIPENIKRDLADLIQQCFPNMPRLSAEALAEAEVMGIVQQFAHVHSLIFQSGHLRTDFVLMSLYGLARQTVEHLEDVIEQSPALRQAFEQGDLPWKCRHGDA